MSQKQKGSYKDCPDCGVENWSEDFEFKCKYCGRKYHERSSD